MKLNAALDRLLFFLYAVLICGFGKAFSEQVADKLAHPNYAPLHSIGPAGYTVSAAAYDQAYMFFWSLSCILIFLGAVFITFAAFSVLPVISALVAPFVRAGKIKKLRAARAAS